MGIHSRSLSTLNARWAHQAIIIRLLKALIGCYDLIRREKSIQCYWYESSSKKVYLCYIFSHPICFGENHRIRKCQRLIDVCESTSVWYTLHLALHVDSIKRGSLEVVEFQLY